MEEKMTKEKKKKELEEIFAEAEKMDEVGRAHLMGIAQGMNLNRTMMEAVRLPKEEAS